jgi:hypothetical protein
MQFWPQFWNVPRIARLTTCDAMSLTLVLGCAHLIEITILAHDGGIFAAKLKHHGRQRCRSIAHHKLADLNKSMREKHKSRIK